MGVPGVCRRGVTDCTGVALSGDYLTLSNNERTLRYRLSMGVVLARTASSQRVAAVRRFNRFYTRQIGLLLEQLPATHQQRLVVSMHTIEQLLGAPPPSRREPAYHVRRHRPGDMGWVVHRHGVLYAREYGWDARFEALVAEIVAKFIKRYDPKRERCWIAELEGEIVGSVFLVQRSSRVAQLRLLLVEPSARGLGIGARLVRECVGFARRVGYRKIMLWTNDVLHAARHIYEKAGFHLVREERHHSFGHDLVGQTWERTL